MGGTRLLNPDLAENTPGHATHKGMVFLSKLLNRVQVFFFFSFETIIDSPIDKGFFPILPWKIVE